MQGWIFCLVFRGLARSQNFSRYRLQSLIKQAEDVTVPSYVTCMFCESCWCYHNTPVCQSVFSQQANIATCVKWEKTQLYPSYQVKTCDLIAHYSKHPSGAHKSLITTYFLCSCLVNWNMQLKGWVHTKMKIESLETHCHAGRRSDQVS